MSIDGPTYFQDTIAAVATAPGRGGIGIVRVSGPGVPGIALALLGFLPEPRYATFAHFLDDEGQPIDHGLAIYFPAPDSFTGEHILELQGHGGPVVLDMLLSRTVGLGSRIAEPGEFSQRAYLNDKLDLSQAEAIADLINSSTEHAAKGAMRSLQGEFSSRINDLVAAVIELRIFVEAAIDFPEEEVDFISDDRIASRLQDIKTRLNSVLEEANVGTLLTEGASVVLLGKPNVGKSSLMNRMTGRDTSIVTSIAGTTRDVVDEVLQIDGIPLKLIDTAGIRESQDEIESEGVRRALRAIEQADLVISVIDVSQTAIERSESEAELERLAGGTLVADRTVRVYNKSDLGSGGYLPEDGIMVSALTGEGMDDLRDHLKRQLGVDGSTEHGFTARRRHVSALERALSAVERGQSRLTEDLAGELLAEELKDCQAILGEITGRVTADDLLGEIFSSFCIGK